MSSSFVTDACFASTSTANIIMVKETDRALNRATGVSFSLSLLVLCQEESLGTAPQVTCTEEFQDLPWSFVTRLGVQCTCRVLFSFTSTRLPNIILVWASETAKGVRLLYPCLVIVGSVPELRHRLEQLIAWNSSSLGTAYRLE